MKRMRRLTLVSVALALIISWSCSRFEDFTRLDQLSTEMQFGPSVGAPLAYGSFTLQDLLEAMDSTGIISQDEDSLLFIYYLDTAYSVKAEEVVNIPNKATTETYIDSDVNIPAWALLPDGDEMTFTKTDKLDFEIEPGDQIDSVLLKDGILNINVNSSFKHSGTLLITSPNIFDENGDSLMLEFIISEADGSFSSNMDYPLDGYKLEINEDAGMAFITVNYNLTLKKEPGNGIDVSDQAAILINFNNMEFSHVYGFVSEREVLNVKQTLGIDFFDVASLLEDITLKEPQFNLHVYNSYGIPMVINLEEIKGRSTGSGEELILDFTPDSLKTFKVDAPGIDELGETVTSTYSINNNNSNLGDLLGISPNKVDFTIVANTGTMPGSGEQNFVLDTSKMDIVAEVVLPMWLQTGGYELQDTLAMGLDSLVSNLSMIERVALTIDMTNEFPLEVRIQAYFMDTLTNIVYDSLFDNGSLPFLESAPVDAEGELIPSLLEAYSIVVELTAEKLANLENVNALWLKASASTTDHGSTFVKFYSHYELKYRISMVADFQINIDPSSSGSGNK